MEGVSDSHDTPTTAGPPAATATISERDLAAQQRREGRRRARWVDMTFAMAVCLAAVFVVVLLVPRPNGVTQPPVDVGQAALRGSGVLGIQVSVPADLPQGWRATSARVTRSTDDVLTWHAGYQTASDQYAAVEQGVDATFRWREAQTNRGARDGTVEVAGLTWERVNRKDKVQRSLVTTTGRVTTIVTGTASYDELAVLAASLAPSAAQVGTASPSASPSATAG